MNKNVTDDELTDAILQILHKIPDYMSILHNIIEPLGLERDDARIILIRRRLVLEGLIEEKEPGKIDSLVRITKEGYRAINLFGTYLNYKKEDKRIALSEREITFLKERNIRLKNLNLIIGILSFIAGILLSSPIKTLLKQWFVGDG